MAKMIPINEDFSYQKIKQLDLESERLMTEGKGPADECICNILSPPEERGKGIGGMKKSIKRAIRTMSGSVRRSIGGGGGGGGGGAGGGGPKGSGLCVNASCEGNSLERGGGVFIPLTTTKGGKGIFTTKETLKRTKPCSGKCGCDKENIVMKHSYANIKIISPDVSSICPCPSSCLNTEALNNIKVTVERVELQTNKDFGKSESELPTPAPALAEPGIEKRSVTQLIDAQYTSGSPEEEHQDNVSQLFEE